MKNRTSSSSSQSPEPDFLQAGPGCVYIRVRLQPRSSRDSVEGVKNGALKIRLTAPPVEGEANKSLLEFLSGVLRIKKSSLSIDSGLKSRDKRVRVEGAAIEDVRRALLPRLF